MLIVFFTMAINGEFDISFILPFIIVMLFMSTFSYDEYNKWDAYAVTLPNGRKNVVKSKYVASIVLLLLSLLITILLNYIVSLISSNIDFNKFIETLLGSTSAIILIESIMYPLIFKYGIEKGRIGLFLLSFVIFGVTSLLIKVIKISIPSNLVSLFSNYSFIILPLMIIISLLISYKISEKIYMKKEF